MKKIADHRGTQWHKYLIEILVITIGIYGAFVLDNWNEERKTRLLEKDMLAEIQVSLKKTLKDLDFNIYHRKQSLNSQDIVIDWLTGTQSYHDSLDHHFAYAQIYTYLYVNNAAFETLKAMGIRLLSNDSLRDQISTLYQEGLSFTTQLDQRYQTQLDYIQNQINVHHYEATMPFDMKRPDLIGYMKPKNIDLMRADDSLIYHMRTLRSNNELNILLFMVPLRASIVNIIDKIEEELQKI